MIEAAEVDTVAAFLEESAARIRGYGLNADSPVVQLAGAELESRGRDASTVAEILVQHFDPYLETMDKAGVDGLTLLATVVFSNLAETWGPSHLRRVIRAQVAALKDGVGSPILPAEPVQSNLPKDPPKTSGPGGSMRRPGLAAAPATPIVPPPQAEAPVEAPVTAQVSSVAAQPPCGYSWERRRFDIYVHASIHPDNPITAFAAALDIHSDEPVRHERRDLFGTISTGATLRRAFLAGCIEVMGSLPSPAVDDVVRIQTPADFIVDNLALEENWNSSEFSLWEELQRLCSARSAISWSSVTTSIASPQAQRCDRAIREWIDGANRAT